MARRNDFSQRGRASSPPIGAPDATQLGAKGSRALVAHAASSHCKFIGETTATQPPTVRNPVTLVTNATAAFSSDGMKAAATDAPMFTRHRSIDVRSFAHCERLSAPSPSLFQTDRLSTYSLSVTGCCLRMNGRFAPTAAVPSGEQSSHCKC